MSDAIQSEYERERDLIRFHIFYNRQHIKSTWILAIVMFVVFIFEESFGGSQSVPVLMRMGANMSARVLAGEYFRLFSSVFLHAGIMHIFFNIYVLFALGSFFNRILGESRFLLIFFLSGLSGSISSIYFSKAQISVGASGAIWGFFGASIALAFFKTTYLPEQMRARLQKITLINLAINLAFSFLPMIDIWAHLGGGVAGFLVSLSFVLGPQRGKLFKIATIVTTVVSGILAILFAASLIYASVVFRPWVNDFASSLGRVNLPEVGFHIDIPTKLQPNPGLGNTASTAYYVFGDPHMDRLVIEIQFFHHDMLGKKPDENWLLEQRRGLLEEASVAKEIKKTVFVRETHVGPLLYYEQPAPNADVKLHNYVVIRADYVVKISLAVTQSINQKTVDMLAMSMITSLQEMDK